MEVISLTVLEQRVRVLEAHQAAERLVKLEVQQSSFSEAAARMTASIEKLDGHIERLKETSLKLGAGLVLIGAGGGAGSIKVLEMFLGALPM